MVIIMQPPNPRPFRDLTKKSKSDILYFLLVLLICVLSWIFLVLFDFFGIMFCFVFNPEKVGSLSARLSSGKEVNLSLLI